MFVILKTELWALFKSDSRISTAGQDVGIIGVKHFETQKNHNIFHIIDNIKVIGGPY